MNTLDSQIIADLRHLDFSFHIMLPSPFAFYASAIRNARLHPGESMPNAIIYRENYLKNVGANFALKCSQFSELLIKHFQA